MGGEGRELPEICKSLQSGPIIIPHEMHECVIYLQRLAQCDGALVAHLMSSDIEGGKGVVEGDDGEEREEILAELSYSARACTGVVVA